MKIVFKVEVDSFEEAAKLETYLDDEIDSNYEVAIDTEAKKRKKIKRTTVTTVQLALVLQCIDKHKKWTDEQVEKNTGVKKTTVYRIRKGIHVLQTKK